MSDGLWNGSAEAGGAGTASSEFASLEHAAAAILKAAAGIALSGPPAPVSQEWQGAFAAARGVIAAPQEQLATVAAFALRGLMLPELAALTGPEAAIARTLAATVVELRAIGQAGEAAALSSLAIEMAGQPVLAVVLPFFVCLEAVVRARLAHDAGGHGAHAASSYWQIARWEAQTAPGPCLVVCGGLSGSGKSFVATGLAATLGAAIVGSDRIRKELAGISPTTRTPAERNDRVYSTRMTDRVYRRLARAAATTLRERRQAVLDATYLTPERRAVPLGIAQELDVPAVIIWCELPYAEAAARLARRPTLAWAVSDGDARVRALQRSGTRQPTGDECGARLLRVDASAPPAEIFAELVPRLRRALAR